MQKITVVYDPINGIAVNDGKSEVFVDSCIKAFRKDGSCKVTVGNSLIINFFRLKVVDGVLSPDEVIFVHRKSGCDDIELSVNVYGVLKGNTLDFCDTEDRVIESILLHAINKKSYIESVFQQAGIKQ